MSTKRHAPAKQLAVADKEGEIDQICCQIERWLAEWVEGPEKEDRSDCAGTPAKTRGVGSKFRFKRDPKVPDRDGCVGIAQEIVRFRDFREGSPYHQKMTQGERDILDLEREAVSEAKSLMKILLKYYKRAGKVYFTNGIVNLERSRNMHNIALELHDPLLDFIASSKGPASEFSHARDLALKAFLDRLQTQIGYAVESAIRNAGGRKDASATGKGAAAFVTAKIFGKWFQEEIAPASLGRAKRRQMKSGQGAAV